MSGSSIGGRGGRPTITDMLESLVKKDDDTRLLALDTRTGTMQVETSVDLSHQPAWQEEVEPQQQQQGSPIDSSMLRDDANSISSDVPIRIIFTVYSVMTAYHFVTATVGILFYLVMLYDETRTVAIVICSVTGTLCAVLYALTAWQRKKPPRGIVFFAQLLFMRILLIAAISQLIGNELLYLLEVTYLFQCAVIIVYTVKWPRDEPYPSENEDELLWSKSKYAKVALIWILVVSTLVWGVGLVLFSRIFFRNFVWLWGIIFYVVLFLVCIYKWRYIGTMVVCDVTRYSISVEDRKLAVMEYYVEFALLAWNKLSSI